jgi:antitoxin (DNA-binding transcriptional repressor) of toxin-antitoxin stability system
MEERMTYDIMDLPPDVRLLIEEVIRVGELTLTRDGEAVAKIVAVHRSHAPRLPGSGRGTVLYMADDFVATPEEFRPTSDP